jgi:hypothetical protein
MTNSNRPRDAREWDCLVDMLAEQSTELTQQEIRAELQRRGIDVTRTVLAIREAIARKHARLTLSSAPALRVSLLQRLQNRLAHSAELGRAELKRMITERLTGPVQKAYFNRLDSAASDDDLCSLLSDLAALDEMTKDSGSDSGEATERDPLC